MKRSKYLFFVILAALVALFAFAACDGGTPEPECTLTFVYDDGETRDSWRKLEKGESYTLPHAKRTGYAFEGWKAGDKLYVAYAEYTVEGDVTFTAQWRALLYSVTYDLYGGRGDFYQPDTGTGEIVPMPRSVPTRDGYSFEGWDVTCGEGQEVEVNSDSFVMPAADVTITARWRAKLYSVTYDLAIGEGNIVQTDKKVGERITLPSLVPTRDGYTFGGWVVTYGWGQTVEVDSHSFVMPAADVTVTAQWKKVYTVKYNLAGGEGSFAQFKQTADEYVALPLKIPTRDGYVFDGWVVTYDRGQTAEIHSGMFVMPAADVTVTAQWEKVYTVKYNLAGGEGSFAQFEQKAGEYVALPLEIPTRGSCEFVGWVVSYGEGQTAEIQYGMFVMPAADVTVTAQWNELVYTVNFSAKNFSRTVEYRADCKLGEGAGYRIPENDGLLPFAYWYYIDNETNSAVKVSEETPVFSLFAEGGTHEITLYGQHAIAVGKEDLTSALPAEGVPEVSVCDIGKGQFVNFSGSMRSKAQENWQTAVVYLYSGNAPKGFFRLDWWVADGTENGQQPQNITEAEGWNISFDGRFVWPDNTTQDYSTYRGTIANCNFGVTIDWTREREIKLTIVAVGRDNFYRQTMFYTITPKDGDFVSDIYHIGLSADAAYAEFGFLNLHTQHDFTTHICPTCGAVDKSALEALTTTSVAGFEDYAPTNTAWCADPSPEIDVAGDFALKFTFDQGALEDPTTIIEIYNAQGIYFDANPNDRNYWYAPAETIFGSVQTWWHGSAAGVTADAEFKVVVYVWRVGSSVYAYYEAQTVSGELVYSFAVSERFSQISESAELKVRLNGCCVGSTNWKAYRNETV